MGRGIRSAKLVVVKIASGKETGDIPIATGEMDRVKAWASLAIGDQNLSGRTVSGRHRSSDYPSGLSKLADTTACRGDGCPLSGGKFPSSAQVGVATTVEQLLRHSKRRGVQR